MMPVDYKKYPPNWRSEIRPAILHRAGNKCEWCGLPNGIVGYRHKDGEFVRCDGLEADAAIEDGERVFRVVLTVAHLNHDVGDNRPENLAALCQKCHLAHDKEQHRETKFKNKHRETPDLI